MLLSLSLSLSMLLALSSTRRAPYPLLLYLNRSADGDEFIEAFDAFGKSIAFCQRYLLTPPHLSRSRPPDDFAFRHRFLAPSRLWRRRSAPSPSHGGLDPIVARR
jgi:hypothetical protein